MSVQWVSSSVEPGTLPSQEMVGPDAARDGDTASPYGTKRKEREASPSVAIGAIIAIIDTPAGRVVTGDNKTTTAQVRFMSSSSASP